MLSVGGLTLCPIHYRAAFASSLIPSPAVSLASFAGSLPSQGDSGVTSFTFSIDPGVRSCLSAGGATSATGELGAPAPDHVPFWFKPDSIFGLFLITTFISTSPGLTQPCVDIMLYTDFDVFVL